jgi:hypothetical protein
VGTSIAVLALGLSIGGADAPKAAVAPPPHQVDPMEREHRRFREEIGRKIAEMDALRRDFEERESEWKRRLDELIGVWRRDGVWGVKRK